MDTVRKLLKKIRGIPIRPLIVRDTSMDWLLDIKAEQHKQEFWERDKRIVRDYNFQKARIALEKAREERQAFADERLENLKKARRKLARMRKQDA
jgi:predicted nucleotidyltransferase